MTDTKSIQTYIKTFVFTPVRIKIKTTYYL